MDTCCERTEEEKEDDTKEYNKKGLFEVSYLTLKKREREREYEKRLKHYIIKNVFLIM